MYLESLEGADLYIESSDIYSNYGAHSHREYAAPVVVARTSSVQSQHNRIRHQYRSQYQCLSNSYVVRSRSASLHVCHPLRTWPVKEPSLAFQSRSFCVWYVCLQLLQVEVSAFI